MKPGIWLAIGAALCAVLAGVALARAPLCYAYLSLAFGDRFLPPVPTWLSPTPPGRAAGVVVRDYWRVQTLQDGAFAIGEPQSDPDNYEYLLVGQKRALLIDSGATARDIRPLLAQLTRLPVTVIPSHLHSDHTRGLGHADRIALIDLPETRALERGGRVRLGRLQFLGPGAGPPPAFVVAEWTRPGSFIDLGGRRVQVLWTPGHTSSSVSIYDPAARRLFTGDLIYPTSLYAFMPDSSLSAYVATADGLLATLPADTILYGAHCCRNDVPAQAPWLTLADLRDVRAAVLNILAGKAHGRGMLLRRFPVNSRMTLLTFYPFGNW